MSVLLHANALWYGLLTCYNPSGTREILSIDKNSQKIKKTHNITKPQTYIILDGYSKNVISDPALGRSGVQPLRKTTSMGLDALAVGHRIWSIRRKNIWTTWRLITILGKQSMLFLVIITDTNSSTQTANHTKSAQHLHKTC